MLSALIFILLSFPLAGQDEPEYDEISVLLQVKGIGAFEIPGLIKDQEIFLPVTDLFDFLRIRNIPAPGLDSISGFFITPDAKFYISRPNNSIIYQEKLFQLQPGDLVRTETNLYLRSSWYGRIFGLNCVFNFRSLSVVLTTELELPQIREMRQAELRKNLSRLGGEITADRTIKRSYPGFRFGMADWSAIGSQEINGRSDARLNLALGAVVAGGETNISLYYSTQDPLSEKQQSYLWRYVNNDFSPLRQIMLGKIQTQAVSTIYNPVVGVQLTNTPSSYRRSFGSYNLSDKTEPGWIVELYVNNVLVDYTTADASGFFNFQVPLVYGNTMVKLKFYGPWGEERTKEQNINIPYNFLPAKTFEYNVSAGMVEDTLFSRFSRGAFNYGLTKWMTVGGGVEYLSSVTSGPLMPFLRTSVRFTGNLLLLGEYTYGVRAMGNLTYRLPSNIQLDVNYKWYHHDQTAINYKYLEERRITASVPLKIGSFTSFNRLSFNQIILPSSSYSTGEWLFSGSLRGVNASLTTYGIFIAELDPYFYTNLSLSVRMPARIVLMPQVQYGITKNEILSARIKAEKYIGKNAFMSLSLERNFTNRINMAEFGLRYDFSFARAGLSIRQSGNRTSFVEQASGSLISDVKTKYMLPDNRNNVGRGGITMIAYFDLNANGSRDRGEPKAPGLNVRAGGGRVIISEKDTTIRIIGLEPYTSYLVELDGNDFENIAWQLPYKTISVTTDANMLKVIEIPVTVAGEASGTVTLEENGNKRGLDRIIVNFYNDKMMPAGRLLTEQDGYYTLFGLKPGKYLVRVDTVQLRRLEMTSEPDSIVFGLRAGLEGDIVENLNFNLKKIVLPEKPQEQEIPVQKVPVVRKDTSYLIVHEVVEELVTISEDCWAIQLGAFRQKRNAEALRKKLEKIFGQKVDIVVADNFYKVRISDIKTRAEVDQKIEILRKNGITELWVITLKAKQQQRVLVEKSDSVAVISEITDTTGGIERVPALMSIQIGAFRSANYAEALKKKMSSMLTNPVEIIFEDGYYKVRVTGFTSKLDIERLLPTLGMMGLRDIWVPPVKVPEQTVKPVVVAADTSRSRVEQIPVDTMRQAPVALPEIKPVEKPEEKAVEIPPVSMRIGEFLKKSQAINAQRKIRKKLGLESEISERWGYYYIIIGGFYTREETYKYYPELAGIGLTKIMILDTR